MTNPGRSVRDVYLARQPIFDQHLKVYGYEVLFRGGVEDHAVIDDANRATSEVLLNAFVEIGLDNVVGECRAFINFTREFLVGQLPLPLATERLVLEILEDVPIDDELVAHVSSLAEQGYLVALDDVVYRENLKPLLGIAQIVKVDLPRIPRQDLPHHVAALRRHSAELLAEKVETYEEFDYCRSLGFDLFQGHFFARPQLIIGKQLRTNQTMILQLLARLLDPLVSVEEIEHLVGSDPAMSYKVLRYVNSSKFAFRRRIESLQQAIIYLGIRGVHTLAVLVALSGISHKPQELISTTIIRALLCEHLCKLRKYLEPHKFFTAGLLSTLDAVLDMPLVDIVNSLNLVDELRDAVLHHSGPVGRAVSSAIAHEYGDWSHIGFDNLEPAEVRDAYLSAIRDANSIWQELAA